MAQNPIPETFDALVALAEDAADGAQTHGATIDLAQNTEAKIRTNLGTLLSAQNTLLAMRVAKRDSTTALQTADSNGKAFIALFINSETSLLGAEWNALWEQAGFTGGSIRIPTRQDDRFVLLGKLRDFLAANPTKEILVPAHPELNVTNAIAHTRYQAVSTARSTSNQANTNNGDAMRTRDAAMRAMKTRLSGLRDELIQLLDDDDARWYAFGFNRPSDPETPGTPENLVLTPGGIGSGTLIADWDDSRRASRYRPQVQVPGEPEPRVFETVEESQTVLTGLPVGVVVTVTITALNDAGESDPSNPAQGTVP